jgi:hypothetical protein
MKEEDKKRIEKAAGGLVWPCRENFIDGAEYEHPISYNQGWNDAIEAISMHVNSTTFSVIQKIKKP